MRPFGGGSCAGVSAAGSAVEEGVLVVGAYQDAFAELVPRTSRGSRRATHELAVDNRGNSRLNATVTADNRLRVTAAAGYEFAFGEDTSGALAALGMNTFFGGHDSSDLSVNASLVANPDLLAAGVNGTPGDGSNAGRIAALADGRVAGLNGRSINDYYNAIVSDVAVRGAAAKAGAQAYAAVNMSLASQRESISGVNLDEETISMLRLERAFQGAARYSSTVDRLIGEMLSLLQ